MRAGQLARVLIDHPIQSVLPHPLYQVEAVFRRFEPLTCIRVELFEPCLFASRRASGAKRLIVGDDQIRNDLVVGCRADVTPITAATIGRFLIHV